MVETTATLAAHYLKMLPESDDDEWDGLSEWEQGFLASVREQFSTRGAVTEKQLEKLEQMYAKVR